MRITSEQAAMLTGVSELLIYRMIEGEQLHRSEMADGRLRICMASLLKAACKDAETNSDPRNHDSSNQSKERA